MIWMFCGLGTPFQMAMECGKMMSSLGPSCLHWYIDHGICLYMLSVHVMITNPVTAFVALKRLVPGIR